MKKDYWMPIFPDHYYHVYDRANTNGLIVFKDDLDREVFMQRWWKYSLPFFDTYAYCLLPDHFHLVIKVKPLTDAVWKSIVLLGGRQGAKFKLGLCDSNTFYASVFKALLISYSGYYNRKYNRRGTLWQPKFKRTLLPSTEVVKEKVQYVHRNPIHHGYCNCFSDWEYSSYNEYYQKDTSSFLKREQVLNLYKDNTDPLEAFDTAHRKYLESYFQKLMSV